LITTKDTAEEGKGTTYYVEYGKISNYSTSYYRIWSGNANPISANFSLTNTGVLTVKEANITGTINAKDGYIGWVNDSNKGWEITSNSIKSNQKITYKIKAGTSYYTNKNSTSASYLAGTIIEDTLIDDVPTSYTDSSSRART